MGARGTCCGTPHVTT